MFKTDIKSFFSRRMTNIIIKELFLNRLKLVQLVLMTSFMAFNIFKVIDAIIIKYLSKNIYYEKCYVFKSIIFSNKCMLNMVSKNVEKIIILLGLHTI
jgi:hypothetical protein